MTYDRRCLFTAACSALSSLLSLYSMKCVCTGLQILLQESTQKGYKEDYSKKSHEGIPEIQTTEIGTYNSHTWGWT